MAVNADDSRPEILLEHRRNTAHDGRQMLGWVIVTAAAIGVFQWFMLPEMLATAPWLVIAFLFLEAICVAVLCGLAAKQISTDGTFVCRITTEDLECVCPVAGCGQTFRIQVKEIAKIESRSSGSRFQRWYVWDRAGQCHWLTPNYDNPVEKFLSTIRQLRPDVEEVQTRDV